MHNAALITQTNAVKSLSDGSILVCSRVSARFLHGFCTVTQDAQVDFRCKIRQGIHKLYVQKLRCFTIKRRYSATSINRDMCHACAFNQRARDSSSLERAKGKPTIHRFKCGLDRGFLFVISARRGLKSATEMRQLQRGFVRIPEHLPEDLIKNE